MVLEPVLCPTYGSSNVVKHAQSPTEKQRYRCRNHECHLSEATCPMSNSRLL
ncbi:hypothetical protein IFO70_38230 [Phormidium tenue FACHB-886]|nr:hypothetical protein [Phormidium tenue FACHB-886]